MPRYAGHSRAYLATIVSPDFLQTVSGRRVGGREPLADAAPDGASATMLIAGIVDVGLGPEAPIRDRSGPFYREAGRNTDGYK